MSPGLLAREQALDAELRRVHWLVRDLFSGPWNVPGNRFSMRMAEARRSTPSLPSCTLPVLFLFVRGQANQRKGGARIGDSFQRHAILIPIVVSQTCMKVLTCKPGLPLHVCDIDVDIRND